MSLVDIALIAAIISGAIFIIYSSLWKKRNCQGCDLDTCDPKKNNKRNC